MNEIARLERELEIAGEDDRNVAIGMLTAALPPHPGLAEAPLATRMDAYRVALDAFAGETLEALVAGILRGIFAFDPEHLPTPPQLARACREIEAPKHELLRQLREAEAEAAGQEQARAQKLGRNGEPDKPANVVVWSGASELEAETRAAADAETP
jgi:hypothetical protein